MGRTEHRLWHGWHLFVVYLPEARQAVDDIGAFVANADVHLLRDLHDGGRLLAFVAYRGGATRLSSRIVKTVTSE
jgi:hypothetical protein